MSSVHEQAHSPPFRWHYAEFDDSSFQIRGRTLFFIVIMLSVVLVIALLFIYVRWLCLFHPPPAPPAASSSSVHSAPDPRPRGLDVAALGNMPIVLYENSAAAANFGGTECCICLGIFGDKEKVKVLQQCRHCFHSECVDKWLAAESSCPLCRASLRVEDSPV